MRKVFLIKKSFHKINTKMVITLDKKYPKGSRAKKGVGVLVKFENGKEILWRMKRIPIFSQIIG
jgi:hypothetical protein